VLLDLINFVDLRLLKNFVLFELILDMNEHHHGHMVAFNEFHLLLEMLLAFELCEVLECLLEKVVLVLQICPYLLFQLGSRCPTTIVVGVIRVVVAESAQVSSSSCRHIINRLPVSCEAGVLNPRSAQVLVLLE